MESFNTRTGEGSENHTVWRGRGAYNAPSIDGQTSFWNEFLLSPVTIDAFTIISAPMRDAATNFGEYLGPH